jgi:hypothetical protein
MWRFEHGFREVCGNGFKDGTCVTDVPCLVYSFRSALDTGIRRILVKLTPTPHLSILRQRITCSINLEIFLVKGSGDLRCLYSMRGLPCEIIIVLAT